MKKIVLLSLIAGVLYACSSVPITGRKQLSLVSDSEVLSLSLQEYKNYIQTAKKSTDKDAAALVVKVGQNIAKSVESYYRSIHAEALLNDYSWEFNLIDDPQVNAFCMPGGKIVVYTGILPVTQDETGLAVVLGHEVAHAIARHANERMSQQLAAQFGAEIVNLLTEKASEEVKTVVHQVYGLGAQYGVLLPFDRKQESEADHLGLILMAIAGYNPQAAVPFWQRMAQNGQSVPEFLSTHPSDATRIADIQKELPEAMEVYKGVWGKYPAGYTPAPGATTPGSSNTAAPGTSSQWHF
ncbi:MAG: M48 family metallopeptidase [Dysgonamonadaceae bacterium]|jgi:predicted Zn-dependent protease|nr:M48 family metallopeptidase [Dysgonamonadaceae bacterium]